MKNNFWTKIKNQQIINMRNLKINKIYLIKLFWFNNKSIKIHKNKNKFSWQLNTQMKKNKILNKNKKHKIRKKTVKNSSLVVNHPHKIFKKMKLKTKNLLKKNRKTKTTIVNKSFS